MCKWQNDLFVLGEMLEIGFFMDLWVDNNIKDKSINKWIKWTGGSPGQFRHITCCLLFL